MKYFSFFTIIISIFIFSCTKNDAPQEIITPKHSAIIRVTVHQNYFLNGNAADSLVPGATVKVYANKEDRDLNLAPDFIKSTDITGFTEFTNLEKEIYFLRVTHPVSKLVIDDSVSTPDKSISLVEIYF